MVENAVAASSSFKETSKTIVFQEFPVANTFYEFKATGTASYSSTIQFGNYTSGTSSEGCTIQGAGTAVWNITGSTYGHIKMYASTIEGMRTATLSASSELRNNVYTNCGTITTNGATIADCTFNSPSATQISCTTGQFSTVTDCVFNSSGTGHAVDFGSVATSTSVSWDCIDAGYGATGTTNATITANVASGQTLTVNVGSGKSTPTYYNTGSGTINVVSGQVTLTLTDIVSGSDIVILSAGTTTELANYDGGASPVTSYDYSYTYAASTFVDICVYKAGHVPFVSRNNLLPASNAPFKVSQTVDRNYVP
jgi:hypothetical protein